MDELRELACRVYHMAHGQEPYLILVDRITSLLSTYTQKVRDVKDGAYHERNLLVAFMSRLYPSHLCCHPEDDLEWEDEWRNIVCVHSPTGQLTWHIHDDELSMFSHLSWGDNHWDGHSTEDKYRRLENINIPPQQEDAK